MVGARVPDAPGVALGDEALPDGLDDPPGDVCANAVPLNASATAAAMRYERDVMNESPLFTVEEPIVRLHGQSAAVARKRYARGFFSRTTASHHGFTGALAREAVVSQ